MSQLHKLYRHFAGMQLAYVWWIAAARRAVQENEEGVAGVLRHGRRYKNGRAAFLARLDVENLDAFDWWWWECTSGPQQDHNYS